MLSVVNEMELVHVIACQALMEIHTTKIEVVDENVKLAMTVMIVWHALHSNAWIHVLESVANWHCVMYQIMCQHVRVHLDTLEIHFFHAVNNHVLWKILIHVHHHHADRTAIAVTIMDKLFAHVQLDILEHHRNVDQNVLFHRNVQQIELASILNVLIHVHTLVVLVPFAMLATIIQFAPAHQVLPAIRLHNALEFVSR